MYVKDMSLLNRDVKDVLIIDNSPTAYYFQPENALPIISWYDDKNDTLLYDYIPFLKELTKVDDVRTVLTQLAETTIDNDVDIEYGIQVIKEIVE
jgi:RNA polymerase II subunit A small phosphatase-like protein